MGVSCGSDYVLLFSCDVPVMKRGLLCDRLDYTWFDFSCVSCFVLFFGRMLFLRHCLNRERKTGGIWRREKGGMDVSSH